MDKYYKQTIQRICRLFLNTFVMVYFTLTRSMKIKTTKIPFFTIKLAKIQN